MKGVVYMNKSEKEILFDAEKSIYELRETIRGRGHRSNVD